MNVINVTDVPNYNEIFGCTTKAVTEYTPTELFNMYNVPEDLHYTFKLKTLTEEDKAQLKYISQASTIELLQWCKANDIDITTINVSPLTDTQKELYEKFENGENVDVEEIEKINSLVSKHSMNSTIYFQKASQVDRKVEKYAIIQKYVVGLSNYRTAEKAMKFKKEDGCDYISSSMWETLPMKVKELVYNKVLELSNLTQWEIINL